MLAKGLSQDGFLPLIIALSQSERRQRLSDFDGLQVEIDCRKLSQLAYAIWKIRRTVKDHKPDVIQGWMYAGNIMASIIGVGIELKFTIRYVRLIWMLKDMGRMIHLNAFLSGYVDGVVVNSQVGAKHHISRGFSSAKMVIIPNGIDTEKFFPDKKSGVSIRQELRVADDTPLVLYAARVDPMKGHQAVISVAKLCPGIQFIFAGKGTELLDVPKMFLAWVFDMICPKYTTHVTGF